VSGDEIDAVRWFVMAVLIKICTSGDSSRYFSDKAWFAFEEIAVGIVEPKAKQTTNGSTIYVNAKSRMLPQFTCYQWVFP
jgi:hypothetical protein